MRAKLLYLPVQYLSGMGIGLEECVWGYAELQAQNILMDMLEQEREK